MQVGMAMVTIGVLIEDAIQAEYAEYVSGYIYYTFCAVVFK